MAQSQEDLVGQLPFRFDDEEITTVAAELQTLMKTPEWDSFTRVLDTMIHGAREQGFADTENIVRWKGFVEGIEAVYSMAVWFPMRARELMKREEVIAERSDRRKKGFPDDTVRLTI